jgi:hypothetical protein
MTDRPPSNRIHSRATGVVRLALAVWLIAGAVLTLADPQRAADEQRTPMSILLPLTGLSFALGVFLFTGFMSRVCGLVLACLGAWQIVSLGSTPLAVAEIMGGVYLMLRGGGAWATDIYVQRMQDRVRKRALSSPE